MKRILLLFFIMFCTINVFSQNYYSSDNPYTNFSVGVGYSHLDRDDYKDNSINLWILACNIYADLSIGTELKDYDQRSIMESYSFNIGYEIPLYTNENIKLLAGPTVGITNIGYDDYYYYGYYDYPEWHTVDTYFNYGIVGGIIINHLQINAKATKSEFSIGLGYNF